MLDPKIFLCLYLGCHNETITFFNKKIWLGKRSLNDDLQIFQIIYSGSGLFSVKNFQLFLEKFSMPK